MDLDPPTIGYVRDGPRLRPRDESDGLGDLANTIDPEELTRCNEGPWNRDVRGRKSSAPTSRFSSFLAGSQRGLGLLFY